MEIHGLVLLAFCTFLVAGGNDFRSDYTYYSCANGWFKFHKVPAKWQEARLRCSLEGAVLASPINSDVSDVMKRIISEQKCASPSGVYTGVHNTVTNTEYSSVEGVSLCSMPDGKCEHMFPGGYSGTPSCMRLLPQEGLVAGTCSDALPYICYKKKTTDLVVTECGTVDTGYRLDNRTGHCYKFHVNTLPWAVAYLTCVAEGGYLAIVNSAAEADIIAELLNKHPPSAIVGGQKQGAALGFHDWHENGVWRTIHGQTLQEAGYAGWAPNRPDNFVVDGEGQHCGSMWRTGLRHFDDVQCSAQLPFVCEKDPASLRPVAQTCNAQNSGSQCGF
ncbi:hypothetical protein O3G_MSEX002289 [Manduca sexta]|uniref:C-type lectin domain-containing protein n=2 Tax=Manduca sexta TaxID=7130 RepID=A0A921YMV2_MANSE|nr:hypothetical protein O3G_MSEX002289 [Manduca sexta]